MPWTKLKAFILRAHTLSILTTGSDFKYLCFLQCYNFLKKILMKFTNLLFTIFVFLISSTTVTKAQEVIWVNKVLEVSSDSIDEFTFPRYNAIQILGKPNVLPQTVSSPCSWKVKHKENSKDSIYVSFEKAVRIRQIIIGETVNPGAVVRIIGYSVTNLEFVLYEKVASYKGDNKRLWNIMIPETKEEIRVLKLEISHRFLSGDKEFDAVGISNSDIPYEPKVNIDETLNYKNQPVNLGNSINSSSGELCPIISPDEKTLFFTRSNHPENIVLSKKEGEDISQDVWFSKLDFQGNWDEAINIGAPINNKFHNAAVSISSDGNSLYVLNVYLPKSKVKPGLSKVSKKGYSWNKPEEVIIDDYQAFLVYNDLLKKDLVVTEFAMSQDENYLVMGLKREETFGGKDLYVSFKLSENHYSRPKSLGEIINSADNEGSPFLAPDNKTLFFNSKGHPSYGDSDIFMTKRLDDSWTIWSEPLNLGPSINSPKWEGFFTISNSGVNGYFSSSNNTIGSDDIFQIKLDQNFKSEFMKP
jgi:hypothetical protein